MKLPPRSYNIGKRPKITTITGRKAYFEVTDEIVVHQGHGKRELALLLRKARAHGRQGIQL